MKVGLSLPLSNNFKTYSNTQQSSTPKIQALQNDTVSFKADEEIFEKHFRKFITDEYADNSREIEVFHKRVDKEHPIIKKLVKDYNQAKKEGKLEDFQEDYIDRYILPIIS